MNGHNGQQPEKFPLVCPACQQRFSIDVPQPEILNGTAHSIVAVNHVSLIRCTSALCRQPMIITIKNVQVVYEAVPLTDEQAQAIEGSPIVKPGINLVKEN